MTHFRSFGTITGVVLEKQRGVKNANKEICMNTFYKMIIMAFGMIAQDTLIDKTKASDLTKREYFWMRTLETDYPCGLNIEHTY